MITISGEVLQRLSQSLRELTPESRRAQRLAVNYAARRARTAGAKAIRDQINFQARYVNERLKVSRWATEEKPEAVITARMRPTRLARFGAKQLVRAAPYARGDRLRSIPSGRKQAGVSVRVKKGGQLRRMRKAFLLPLMRGKMPGDSSVMGIFIRTGRDKKAIKHLYGPSVDQVFRSVRTELDPSIRQDLAREYGRLMRARLARIAQTTSRR